MRSGVTYYEYEKHEKFEDYDRKANAELGTLKSGAITLMMNLSFILSIVLDSILVIRTRSRSSRRPTPLDSPKGMSSTHRVPSSSSTKGTSSSRCRVASKTLRMRKSWELILPPKGWMCEGDEEEKEIGGMKPSVEKKETSEEDPKKEEDPEEEVHASSSLPMDIDAIEDYLQFIEELERRPEYSPIRSEHASVPESPEDPSDGQSDSHNTSSYDLSVVWQPPLLGPNL
ncbi:hypothetical protein PIB30_081666 [Stylosanthes scabra]|uniref:Uncharacterized protein n=1 Tax=Stylosanthes scabra TaxID=79078 RepID=A0ABU6USZ5_9FABA|nr:hypothetical protein [Stylosanthes scabra]